MAYQYYRALTLASGLVPNTDQINFPVKIAGTLADLKTTGNGGLVTNASGYDIQFFLDVGLNTPLKFERVVWSATAGTYVFYVNVPVLSHSFNTLIYMAYGNSAISTDQQDSANTWNANFKAVYHFGDGTTLSLADSTSNGNTLTNGGGTAGTGLDGQGAISLVSASSQYAEISTAIVATEPFSVESIFKPTTLIANAIIASADSSAQIQSAHELLMNGGATTVMTIERSGAAAPGTATAAGTISAGTWNYAASIFNATNSYSIDLNGATRVTTTTSITPFVAPTRFTVGARSASTGPTRTNFWNGLNGEVRVSNIALGVDWTVVTWNSIINLASFVTTGSKVIIATMTGISTIQGISTVLF